MRFWWLFFFVSPVFGPVLVLSISMMKRRVSKGRRGQDDVIEIVRIWGLKPCWISSAEALNCFNPLVCRSSDFQIFFWLSRRPTYPNFSAYWCSRKDLSLYLSFPCSHTEVIRILGRCDPTATAIFHQCRGTDGDGRPAN